LYNHHDLVGTKKEHKIIFKSAELVYDAKDYTSATILYFKTLFLILDLHILENYGKIPKITMKDFFNYWKIDFIEFPILIPQRLNYLFK